MDEVSGLYFAQASRYDAGNGRFVSEDLIIKGNVFEPISLSAYLYVYGTPETSMLDKFIKCIIPEKRIDMLEFNPENKCSE